MAVRLYCFFLFLEKTLCSRDSLCYNREKGLKGATLLCRN